MKFLVSFLLIIFSCVEKKEENSCDLLRTYSIKIPHLKFMNCEVVKQPSQNLIIANYRVETQHNKEVEKYLRDKYKMGKIVQFKWAYEVENYKLGLIKSFKDKNGELLTLDVSMFGEMKSAYDPKEGKTVFCANRDEVPYYKVTIILSESP